MLDLSRRWERFPFSALPCRGNGEKAGMRCSFLKLNLGFLRRSPGCQIHFMDYCALVQNPVHWKLKLLYDGGCPFCVREVRFMEKRNQRGHLAFEDISRPDFDPARYGLTRDQVMGVMHAVYPDGRVITRVEVFIQAYRQIGLGWLMAPLAWPPLRPLANWGYELFARYRISLGRLLGGKIAQTVPAPPR